MIKIDIWTKRQNRHVEMPEYQLEIEGTDIWKLVAALEQIAKAISKCDNTSNANIPPAT
jgi:hypothetical protein